MSESDFLIDLRRDYGKLQPSVRKQKSASWQLNLKKTRSLL